MVGVKGYDAAILAAMERHNVRIISKSSNANTITHYLAASLKAVRRVIADLEKQYPSASVTVRKVAIVSVIGSDLRAPGLTAAATGALADAGIEMLGLHQAMRNVDIQFVIDDAHYDKSVIALHRVLVEDARSAPAKEAGAKKAA
jgi:aspartate kinase